MKWYTFFLIVGISALTVFGLYAQNIRPFLYPWVRPVFLFLTGAAFLTSEWMVAEEDCRGEVN